MTAMEDEMIADLQHSITELRRERDEREAERDAALAREAALAEVLNVINHSPGDPGPVFEVILEKAHRLCGADLGTLMTYDGEHFRSLALHGYPDKLAAFMRQGGSPSHRQARLVRGERFVHIPDLRALESQPNDDGLKAHVSTSDVRTFLLVPLRKDGTLRGLIGAHRREVRPFSDAEISLLESFAAQAVIAMENARLLGELRERTAALAQRNSEFGEQIEHQAATIDVLKEMSASLGDAQPVFDLIVRQARNLLPEVTNVTLSEYDGELVHLRTTAGGEKLDTASFDAYSTGRPRVPDRGSLTCRAILDRVTIHIRNMEAEPGISPAVRNLGHKTQVSIPLMRDGRAIGALAIGSLRVDGISDTQIELLKTFAEQAVIAISSAETYRALQERTADLQESLEYQTATSDVLKVISRSTFDLQPVLNTVVETAARLCDAEQAVIYRREGQFVRLAANFGFPPEYEVAMKALGAIPFDADSPTVGWRTLREGRPVHIHDAAEVPGYTEVSVRLGKQRTSLGVPLLREGETIGNIVLARQRVEPFTDRQIDLVSTFADQAVIAMENARLITEQQEALERQTATAEVLQVINASPGDLAPVFDTVLDRAMRLCEAALGTLVTYDGERIHTLAALGVPPAYTAFIEKNHLMILPPGGPLARVVETKSSLHTLDLMAEESYRAGATGIRALVDLGGARTALLVPLRKDETVLGFITIYRQEVRAFSDKQMTLLENFAAQAVIAMENARLISEQREALEQQTATAEVLQVINASPGDLAPVFDAMLEKAMRLCGAAFGSLFTYDGDRFQSAAQRCVPAAYAEFREKNPPRAWGGSPMARLVETSHTIHVLDVMAEAFYQDGDTNSRAIADLGGARTALIVPLLKDNVLLGCIVIYRQEVRAFSDKQIALLENFAAQAVIAMENARLLGELRERTDELARRQAELRVTFENMGDGVAMFDETPRLVAWNSKFQEFFNVPDGVLAEHRTYADYIRYLAERGDYGPDADMEDTIRQITKMTGVQRTYERVRPDGRVIEIRNNPVAGGGFVLIFSDITERKRSEAEIVAARDAAEQASRTIEAAFRELKTAQANLIQAEKMASLGQLTAGIAHEIKNPLNFVNNFAILSVELLNELKETIAKAVGSLDEDQRGDIEEVTTMLTSNLQKITEHGQRADGIVKSMLEHSRGASGERRKVDINGLTDEALNLAYHGARAQDQSFNITLERDFGEDIGPIEVNPQDMTRVFLNLFSNGFYAANKRARSTATPDFAPTLRVMTRDVGEAVEIRVRDNGTGIPGDIRDKLFQPFFTTKPTGEGTGLGLSITYDIVTQQHGGTITVDSEVDTFTEFVIMLPRGMFSNDGGRT
jgi:GAF domain-containing protein/nitrogen-specific signal transduction histidine kinase